MEEDETAKYLAVLERLPEREQLIADNYQGLLQILAGERGGTDELRERIRLLLGERAKEVKPRQLPPTERPTKTVP
jgi:hypothetical protein